MKAARTIESQSKRSKSVTLEERMELVQEAIEAAAKEVETPSFIKTNAKEL